MAATSCILNYMWMVTNFIIEDCMHLYSHRFGCALLT